MPIKILNAVRNEQGYHLLVHLDTAMTVQPHEAHELQLTAGSPHPHFVKVYYWPHRTAGVHQTWEVPATEDKAAVMRDMTDAEYLEHIEEMVAQ